MNVERRLTDLACGRAAYHLLGLADDWWVDALGVGIGAQAYVFGGIAVEKLKALWRLWK